MEMEGRELNRKNTWKRDGGKEEGKLWGMEIREQ